jgi:hypothetical protein
MSTYIFRNNALGLWRNPDSQYGFPDLLVRISESTTPDESFIYCPICGVSIGTKGIVTIALNHMHKRREALLSKRADLTKEIAELDAAILALG